MKKYHWLIPITVFFTVLVLNIMAINSLTFSDFYVENIFPLWLNTYGRLINMFPFSVGELMIAVTILLVGSLLIFSLLAVIFLFYSKSKLFTRKFISFYKKYSICMLYFFSFICLIMTLNCFPLYRCSSFEIKYLKEQEKEYTYKDLCALRDYVVAKSNSLSKQVDRDENGNVIYNGNMESCAIESMKKLGEIYPRLSGYYSTPKKLASSNFISQQNMRGYYFPFSLEANYNTLMTVMNKPSTMCHELAHTKGFLLEDEANMISFLACINSDDLTFQYSGYLSVLNYIDRDFYKSTGYNKEIYNSHVKINNFVKNDNKFLTEETRLVVENHALIKTETVKIATKKVVNINLQANGVPDGIISYEHVVGLLINYYDGEYLEIPMDELLGDEYLVASAN